MNMSEIGMKVQKMESVKKIILTHSEKNKRKGNM